MGLQGLLIAAATLTMFYCGQTLTPAINKARDEGPSGKARFDRLHRLSVILNGIVLIMLIGLTIAHAARPPARTKGIVEMSPIERTQRELKALAEKNKNRERTQTPARTGAEESRK